MTACLAVGAAAVEKPLWLVYCVGINDGMRGSDGIDFRVEIGEVGRPRTEIASVFHKESTWRACRVSLNDYRHQNVVIRLSAGPHETATEDWGVWGDVAIVEGELPKDFAGNLEAPGLRVVVNFVDLPDFATGALGPTRELTPLGDTTGGVFNGTVGVCGGIKRRGFFSHPCFKGEFRLCPVFADFAIDLSGEQTVVRSWDLKPFVESPFAAADNYAQTATVAAWSEGTKQAQKDAAKTMVAELHQAMAEGKPGYTIAPGEYRFDHSLKSQLSFNDVTNFAIQAEGATFWIEDDGGLRFTDCQGMTLRGLTIDCDPLPFTQGVIIGTNARQNVVVIRIIDGFPLPTAFTGTAMMVIPFKPDGTLIPHHMDTVGDVAQIEGRVFKVYLNQGFLLQGRQSHSSANWSGL